jgi:hypothetical protein
VLAYERNGILVDYLRHPDFIFDNQTMASEHREDAFMYLQRVVPGLSISSVHVAPIGEFY